MHTKNFILLILIAVLVGCAGPKLYVQDLQIDSFDGTTLHYTATVLNSDKKGPGLCKPKAVDGPIILQAWSANTQDLSNRRRVQGGTTILLAGNKLDPGSTITHSGRTVNPLIQGTDIYLVIQIYTSDATVTFPNPAIDETGKRCQRIVTRRAVTIPYGN